MAWDPEVIDADTVDVSPDEEPWVDLDWQLRLDFARFYLMSKDDDLAVGHLHVSFLYLHQLIIIMIP